jgi:hypothetical protein
MFVFGVHCKLAHFYLTFQLFNPTLVPPFPRGDFRGVPSPPLGGEGWRLEKPPGTGTVPAGRVRGNGLLDFV